MKFTTEEIQEAIAASSRRQILEDVIEELAHEALMPRELETCTDVALGATTAELAQSRFVASGTVRNQFYQGRKKLGGLNERQFLTAVISKLLESYE